MSPVFPHKHLSGYKNDCNEIKIPNRFETVNETDKLPQQAHTSHMDCGLH